jgi:hypothetical protein
MRVPSSLVKGSGKFAFAGREAPAGSDATGQSTPGFSTNSSAEPDEELLLVDDELELEEVLLVELLELEDEVLELDDDVLDVELELDELELGVVPPPHATSADERTSGATHRPQGVGVSVIFIFCHQMYLH